MYKYCDCRDFKGEVNLRRANNGQNKMKATETDKNGVCIFCKHHAIENRNILKEANKRGRVNVSSVTPGIADYLRS